jgi:hypothetical protein
MRLNLNTGAPYSIDDRKNLAGSNSRPNQCADLRKCLTQLHGSDDYGLKVGFYTSTKNSLYPEDGKHRARRRIAINDKVGTKVKSSAHRSKQNEQIQAREKGVKDRLPNSTFATLGQKSVVAIQFEHLRVEGNNL